ncbi:unnamed protein product [Caenorhabditis auriculariae]|uniref:Uncharacterized protein n=1 Tax=Caenorhabditis auriculariae TaxID=2777116 RepID=A0A8S1H417_9PELO|nr:unnamed protein product [Caenorhabditis auriculariae]
MSDKNASVSAYRSPAPLLARQLRGILREFIMSLSLIDFIAYSAVIFTAFVIIRYFIELLQISNLKRRAVFITGCDTGFGHDLAIRCLQHGMPVFAGCLTVKGSENLEKVSKLLSGKLRVIIMDVTKKEDILKARKILEDECPQYGGLHGLVNNAGITSKEAYDDFLTLEDYKKVADVNTWGVIQVTHELKHLVKKTKGRIVTVASICARVVLPSNGPYNVAKHAVAAYCDTIRQELRLFGVSVHILEPGFFKTPLIDFPKMRAEMSKGWTDAPKHVREEYGEEFYKKSEELSLDFLQTVSSDRIDYVIDAYFHALTAVFPRPRYQVGWDSILLFIPFSLIPTPIQDLVYKVAALRLPKPAACR